MKSAPVSFTAGSLFPIEGYTAIMKLPSRYPLTA